MNLGYLRYIISARTTDLNKALEASERKVKGFSSRISSNITGAMRSVGGQFAAAFAIGSLIKGAIESIAKFDQAQADLAAVTGKSRHEIKALTEDAKRLGGTTAFTANEVSQLQKEFAKLGFSQKEILNATEATLQLAAATGEDLARSAGIAGATVRAFGMDTKETQRVVDVMAKSFSSSALDLSKFEVAMRSVAPVAKSAGVGIEETTALLGVLANRGIDASTAGTALRNIFLDLSDKGLTWNEAMEKINSATDKNKEALDLFGKRGATVATILAGTAGEADRLTQSLKNSGGAAQEMADKQLDSLTGKVTLMKSAWEGLILSMEDGTSLLGQLAHFLIETATAALNLATKWSDMKNLIGLVNPGLATFIDMQHKSKKAIEGARQAMYDFHTEWGKQNAMNYGPLEEGEERFFNFGQTVKRTGEEIVETDGKVKNIAGSIGALMEEIKTLKDEQLKATSTKGYEALQGKIDATTMKIKHLTGEVGNLIKEMEAGTMDLESLIEMEDLEEFDFGNIVKANGAWKSETDEIQARMDAMNEKGIEGAEEMQQHYNMLADVLNNNVGTAAGMLNTIFANMVQDDPFNAMIDSLKALIVQLGIAAGIAALLAVLTGGQSAFASTGAGNGFTNIFGMLTGINLGKVPALASGGIVTGPTMAMIGDNASGTEAVIPLEKFPQIFGNLVGAGGIGGAGRLEAVVSGSSLKFVLDRTNEEFNRFN